jgi:hypothetical protein
MVIKKSNIFITNGSRTSHSHVVERAHGSQLCCYSHARRTDMRCARAEIISLSLDKWQALLRQLDMLGS